METKTALKFGFTRVEKIIMISVVIITGLFPLVIPYSAKQRSRPSHGSCIANLKQIDGAKQQWAAQNKKLPTDIPADSDIFGPTLYIRAKPLCPQGGTYSLNAVSAEPSCSKSGAPDFHTL